MDLRLSWFFNCCLRVYIAVRHTVGYGLLLLWLLASIPALADAVDLDDVSLADLSLEQLATIEITSAAKKKSTLLQTPNSVFVITRNDIRRSGASSLPEALRLAPNLQVAQVDAYTYAISARGFNNAISNKLQVLIDGRIVYTPLYSGVFWDAQDVLLEDVERIEVISGPAAAIWGANAVNGVINVITRQSADTQNSFISVGRGTNESNVALRHGDELGDSGHYRVYAKFLDRDNTERADGPDQSDSWRSVQTGFRADWLLAADSLQLQGDAYRSDIDQLAPGDKEASGFNILLRWQRQLDSGASVSVAANHDYTARDYPDVFSEHLYSSHIELLYQVQPLANHNIQWGLDYRQARDRIDNSQMLAFLPANKRLDWFSGFVQDEIKLSQSLKVTLDVRVEHNDYTGTEFMPAARFAWSLDSHRMVWGAISRAVRTPSRIDKEIFVPDQPPYMLGGGQNFTSETALVYELGYRHSLGDVSWSLAAFCADYDHLRSLEPDSAGGLSFNNGLEGSSRGLEAWGSWRLSDYWQLNGGLLLQQQRFHVKPGSADVNNGESEGNDPSHQWSLRSQWDLDDNKQLDLTVRRVGVLPHPDVPAYVAVDMRLGWQWQKDVEFSLTGRNLFDGQHPEFGASPTRSEIERSVYLAVRWSL